MNPSPNPEWVPPISILGVPFDNVTTPQTLSLFKDMIESKSPHYVATANVDFVVQAGHDVELRRILNDAHLVLADGMPLVWASHLLGNPLPERVAGSDLVPLLLEQAERLGHSVFFLGGQEAVTAKALENIRAKHPALKIAGSMSPPFAALLEMDHEGICAAIKEAKPDMLLVSFGCPKQEKWISMNYRELGVPVSMGVGATIDFLAGAVKRAPVIMQRTGTEWIFRLAQEPRRLFKRYLTDMIFFGAAIMKQIFKMQGSGRHGSTKLIFERINQVQVVDLPECFDAAAVKADADSWKTVISNDKSAVFLGHRVRFADSTAIAMLARVAKDLRVQGNYLVIAEPSYALWRALEAMQVEAVMEICGRLSEAMQLIKKRLAEKSTPVGIRSSSPNNVIHWQGEVTAVNAADIWEQTEEVLAVAQRSGEHKLTIDLSTVRFVDSTGVGLMVRVKKLCSSLGVTVSFESPSQAAASVIRTLRMEAFLFSNTPALSA
jgi:N-acetylglucosaminyldiphosphoundecaprenol N-acetyl-beta-D-mannosaminyltransferase